ncbi:MAG: enoyl-CoA hydratase [Burkholderiaceae bacterium]
MSTAPHDPTTQPRHAPSVANATRPPGDVVCVVDGHVATITLRNEGRFNAMALDMWRALAQTLERLRADDNVRAVLLRGDGDKAFVSGADISEFGAQRNDVASVQSYDRAVKAAQDGIIGFPRPVVAAISGICYGGGLGLALSCDLRYCAPNARFRMPAARLGLGYSLDGVQRMVDVLGVARASELFYAAPVVDAQTAASIGLVNAVRDDVFGWTASLAADIASNAPLTVAAAKLAFNTVLGGSAPSSVSAVEAALQACFSSRDYAEGRAAFAEKRSPRFTGE